MRKFYHLFFLLSVTFGGTNALMAQNVTMSNGTFQSCLGAFFDSGGQGGPGYSNNEFFTATICPDVEGDVVTIIFNTFNLDTSGPQNSWDSMAIYDGNSTQASTLGVYTGNQLNGITVSASPLNTSGCLTFVFQSNNTGTGSFGGSITCETPCDRPIAVATYDAPESKKICVGDVINFDGSASFPGDGFEIAEWLWDFKDGTTYTGGPIISHSWDVPGEYVVELYLVDNNGCASTNLVSLQVLVATFPSWDPFPSDALLCLGEEITLEAFPEQYNVTWAGPDVSYGNDTNINLPDNVGVPYSSEIFVTGFAPGQTLNNVNDLLGIDISIEHSFLFDLVISVTCPSGQQVFMHQQMAQPGGPNVGANGTDLGVPDQEFWDYTWAPNAPQGTWSQVATGGGNNALPEGVYSSLQPLNLFVGCDLNGIWTMTIVDMWAGDNGELNGWGLNFNPAIVPDVTEFTPQIGVQADSSFWSYAPGSFNVLLESPNGNSITIQPTDVGVYDFTFQVTNNHGCTHEETVTVTVELAGQADAGPDMTMCGPGTMLQGGLDGIPAPQCSAAAGNYTYCYGHNENLTLTYCPDNQGDGVTFIDIVFNAGSVENFWDPFFVYDGPNAASPLIAGPLGGNLAGLSWQATNPSGCLTIVFTSDGSVSCTSGSQTAWDYDVGCTQGEPLYEFEWSPADLLSNPNSPSPEVLEISGPTVFTLATWPDGRPDCVSYDEVTVFPAYDYSIELTPASCNGNDGVISVEVDPDGVGGGPWTVTLQANAAVIDQQETNGGTVNFSGLGFATYVATISDTEGCSYSSTYVVDEPAPMLFTVSGDNLICIGGTSTLEASSTMDVNGNWTYTWDNSVGTGSTVNVSPLEPTTYTVFATDAVGCESEPVTFTVNLREPLAFEIAGPDEICAGTEADLFVVASSGGLPPYTFTWQFEETGIGTGAELSPTQTETGTYCAIMSDACETPVVSACIEVLVEPILVPLFEADTTRGCVPAAMQFTILNDPATYASAVWNLGNGSSSTSFNPPALYDSPGLYDVSLELTTPTGCIQSTSVPGYITVHPNPVAGFFATPQPTDILYTEIEFTDQSSNNVILWDWLFGVGLDLGFSNEQHPVFEFPLGVGGHYPVRLVVTDENGCTDQRTKTIIINELLNVYVPNAFTPNNDGINDVFFVRGTDIDPERFELMVFNRWGERVFYTKDIDQVWDGSVNGGAYYAQNEVYTWRLIVYSKTTVERYELTGSVVVMR